MLGPVVLIAVGILLVLLGNALGAAGKGTEASFLGCLPGIPGILCIVGGVLWLLVLTIIWIVSWTF